MTKRFLSILGLLALLPAAQAQTVSDILSKLDATQKSARDLSFRLSGSAQLDAGTQKLDLNIQSIPASGVARLVFNAPDALADNVVVVDGKEVRNYLYLTNQITVTPLSKASQGRDLAGLDPTQLGNLVGALKSRYDIKLLGSTGAAGNRLYQLEATPKSGVQGGKSRVWVTENGWRPTRFQALSDSGQPLADLNVSDYKVNAGLTAARLRALPKDAEIVKQ